MMSELELEEKLYSFCLDYLGEVRQDFFSKLAMATKMRIYEDLLCHRRHRTQLQLTNLKGDVAAIDKELEKVDDYKATEKAVIEVGEALDAEEEDDG